MLDLISESFFFDSFIVHICIYIFISAWYIITKSIQICNGLRSALAGLPRLCQLCEGNIRTVPTIKCDGQHHLGIVGRRLPHLLDVQIRRYEVSYISRMTTAAGNAASTEATSPNSGFACPFTAPYIFTLFNQGCHR